MASPLRKALMTARTDLRNNNAVVRFGLAKPLGLISETLTCLTVGSIRTIPLARDVGAAINDCAYAAKCANDTELAERLYCVAHALFAVVGR